MIYLEKVNEVYLRVTSDDAGDLHKISELYSFRPPNIRFHPKVKLGLWDGVIRLFNPAIGLLYIGLASNLISFLKETGRQFTIIPKGESIKEQLDEERVESFVSYLNMTHDPYDFQIEAFRHCIESGRSLVSSPTSSGKSLIIFMIAMYHWVKHKRKSLIIVPTIQLCYQLKDNFMEYSQNKINEEYIELINGEEKKNNDRNAAEGKEFPFTISTWQSIYKRKPEFFAKYDVIIADEVHTFKSTELVNMMCKTTKSPFKYGFSGTLSNDMEFVPAKNSANIMCLTGLFGPVYTTISIRELMDKELVTQLKICMVMLKHKHETRQLLKDNNYDYQKEIKIIGLSKERREIIAEMTEKLKGNNIYLFNFKETYGLPLFEELKEKFPDKKVFYMDGDTPVEERNAVSDYMRENDNCLGVFSYGIFSTGISIPNLHNLFLVTPYRSGIRIKQSIGRILRLNKNKKSCLLIDFIDDLQLKKKNTTLKHGSERLKIYKNQEFDQIKFIEREIL